MSEEYQAHREEEAKRAMEQKLNPTIPNVAKISEGDKRYEAIKTDDGEDHSTKSVKLDHGDQPIVHHVMMDHHNVPSTASTNTNASIMASPSFIERHSDPGLAIEFIEKTVTDADLKRRAIKFAKV